MAAITTPLRFRRIPKETVWGGRVLERVPGIALPAGMQVGETWELVDREAENSVVDAGPHAGVRLRELMERAPQDLLGRASATAEGRFPLLVKYIDATRNLSIQVHPDDAAAARLGDGAEGKTEAWYFLAAEPGARILAGIAPGVDAASFARDAGTERTPDLLRSFDVVPGECLCVPGGTVHSICAGVTLLEVQQNSDTTFRIWDWGRVGRELHLEQARACAKVGFDPGAPVRPAWREVADGLRAAELVATEWFGMTALRLEGRARLSTEGAVRIYVVVAGRGSLGTEGVGAGDAGAEVELGPGDTWLVPAAAGEHWIRSGPGGLSIVRLRADA